MARIPLDELLPLSPQPRFALFALGFRPFFLLAGLAAVLLIGIWLALYRGYLPLALFVPPTQWHAHEMLFGFTAAVVAGFLLTAVQNWTGMRSPSGMPLVLLVALWLIGRMAPFLPALPAALYALLDAALLPAVAAAIARPILRAKQARNLAFPLMLLVLTLANLLVHAEWLGLALTASAGFSLAVFTVVLIMVVLGGRVIPSFTDNKLRTQARRWKPIEWLAPASVLLTLVGVLIQPVSTPTALIAGLAAAIHAIRLSGWYTPRCWSVPLLWVLHLGYAWIVLGFALTALAALGLTTLSLALHAFTAGAIGTLTLGMMARVSLGHTGRLLESPPLIHVAFALVTLAAVVRVLWPLVDAGHHISAVLVSGLLWMLAFAIFTSLYAPMLVLRRVDGKPG